MAKKRTLADPTRTRILEIIDAEIESARESIQRANDFSDLLNALDTTGDKIEIDGNVIVGAFNKKET